MKKFYIIILSLLLGISQTAIVFAEDFSGRESEMNEKCAAIYDVETQNECKAYQAYLEEKNASLDDEIEQIQNQIASVGDDIDTLTEQVNQNNQDIESLTNEIAEIETHIETANRAIKKLETQIEEKKEDIEKRDAQMRERLVELQVYSGSNVFIDFLMGSSSFADLLRRSEILGELNTYENDQILLLKAEKEELEEDIETLETQQKVLETQMLNLENSKTKLEELNKVNEQLIATYREKLQSLMDQKVAAQRAQSSIPTIDTSIIPTEVEDDSDDSSDGGNSNSGWTASSSLIVPIIGDWYYSAGTWEYSSGGMHLGMDFATGSATGLKVVAPANGIVIWTYNGCDNNGYLGNTCGNPIYGGNTIVVVVRADNATYAISFSHLTSAVASIGSMVTQGEVIGYTGNSGNSTGPHCHVEIIYLGDISLQEAVNWYNTGGGITYAGDTTFGAGWTSPNACGSPPCRLRPESFWLS